MSKILLILSYLTLYDVIKIKYLFLADELHDEDLAVRLHEILKKRISENIGMLSDDLYTYLYNYDYKLYYEMKNYYKNKWQNKDEKDYESYVKEIRKKNNK